MFIRKPFTFSCSQILKYIRIKLNVTDIKSNFFTFFSQDPDVDDAQDETGTVGNGYKKKPQKKQRKKRCRHLFTVLSSEYKHFA